jgi:hypothetical protein
MDSSEDAAKSEASLGMTAVPPANVEIATPNQFRKEIIRAGLEGWAIQQGSLSRSHLKLSSSSGALSLQRITKDHADEVELIKLPSRRFDNLSVLLPASEDSYITILELKERNSSRDFVSGSSHGHGDVVMRVKKSSLKPVKTTPLPLTDADNSEDSVSETELSLSLPSWESE